MDIYGNIIQARTTVAAPNTSVAITIPIGARDALIAVEDSTLSFRISMNNALNATTQGLPVPATGYYSLEGVNVTLLTLYISVTGATTAFLMYTTDT